MSRRIPVALPLASVMSVRNYLLELQAQICAALEREDGEGQFREDLWQHTEGGGGVSRLMHDGRVFEKAGVNFSHIYGPRLPPTASSCRPELAGRSFQALGVSLVVHPLNPYVPASHANIRFFIAGGLEEQSAWWFGGGYDLTPCYGFVQDCVHWHSAARKACEPFGKQIYPRFKQQCDEYFFISHRKEARGIGGLFFDNLTDWGFETCFAFSRSVGDSFLPAYLPIVSRRKNSHYGERERLFQLYRRGRYVEFNLVCDRGTLFGLQSNGRVESILMSLPPLAAWSADCMPHATSADEEVLRDFLAPRDWLDAA